MVAEPVNVWLFDLSEMGGDVPSEQTCSRVLSDGEIQRSHQIANPEQAREYRISLTLIRFALERFIGTPMSGIAFTRDPRGKPGLPDSDCFMSYAHIRGFAALAVSRAGPIGIDTERHRIVSNDVSLDLAFDAIRSVLPNPNELPHDDEGRRTALWTVLEAITKAHGKPLREILTEAEPIWLRKQLDNPRKHRLFYLRPTRDISCSICVLPPLGTSEQMEMPKLEIARGLTFEPGF